MPRCNGGGCLDRAPGRKRGRERGRERRREEGRWEGRGWRKGAGTCTCMYVEKGGRREEGGGRREEGGEGKADREEVGRSS